MAAVPQSHPEPEELQNLQVRVVRMNELGAQLPQPEEALSAPSRARAEPQAHQAAAQATTQSAVPTKPPTTARSSALPAARPPTPPAARPSMQPAAHPSTPPAARPTPQPAARPSKPPAPQPAARPPTQREARPSRQPAPVPAPPKGDVALEAARTETQRKPLLSAGRLFFVLTCVLLYYGWSTQTERYITPKRGMGYALGIIGGSLMLILLVYSLRKRWLWLSFLGSTPAWFRFHMVLGIVGPLAILYHSNFTTGATNSNVALFAMLTVAGSGLVGRYIYSHIHLGLYGRKLELGDLRAGAEGLRTAAGGISFLPELVTRIESAEQRVLKSGPKLSVLGFAKPLVVGLATLRARWQLHGYIRHALQLSARRSAVVATEQRRLRASARAYVDRRLTATRRVAEFEGYERLFSLWHALHIPLIFMMIIAAVIHVIAVHVY
jgi:hypothetical protein